MNALLHRLLARYRRARHLRRARATIRAVERSTQRRLRQLANPGYADLADDPAFLIVVFVAIMVLVADVTVDPAASTLRALVDGLVQLWGQA